MNSAEPKDPPAHTAAADRAHPAGPDAFDKALHDHLAGEHEAAERQYCSILAADPEHAPALHFLGVLRHQQGHGEEGRALVQKSLVRQPQHAEWHNTLGNMLSAQGLVEEAVAAFLATLEQDPNHSDAWNNLGSVLLTLGHAGEAATALRNAVALNPALRAAHQNLGDAYRQLGDSHAAALSYCAEYVLRPLNETQRDVLGIAYSQLGRDDEAAQVYEAWLADEPGHPIASHLLAANRGQAAGDRASPDYLRSYFDAYADTFEHKLVDDLAYSVPPLVRHMLERHHAALASLRILDAGCGTGLCGPHLQPFARQLTGVDLSSRSLAIAQEKNLYDSLHAQDIVEYLRNSAPATWDLMVAADVLIYFGNLASFLQAAQHALAEGGQLLASFETTVLNDPDPAKALSPGYVLQPSGRYRHDRDYLLRTLQTCGFTVDETTPVDIRTELGRPVRGLLLLATKSADAPKHGA